MNCERIKYQHYSSMRVNNFFWRTHDQQAIDWIEEREGNVFAYEMKWGKTTAKVPGGWANAYPGSAFEVVSMENFGGFVGL